MSGSALWLGLLMVTAVVDTGTAAVVGMVIAAEAATTLEDTASVEATVVLAAVTADSAEDIAT